MPVAEFADRLRQCDRIPEENVQLTSVTGGKKLAVTFSPAQLGSMGPRQLPDFLNERLTEQLLRDLCLVGPHGILRSFQVIDRINRCENCPKYANPESDVSCVGCTCHAAMTTCWKQRSPFYVRLQNGLEDYRQVFK